MSGGGTAPVASRSERLAETTDIWRQPIRAIADGIISSRHHERASVTTTTAGRADDGHASIEAVSSYRRCLVQFRCKTQNTAFDPPKKWVPLRDGATTRAECLRRGTSPNARPPLSPTTPLRIAILRRVLW